MEAVDEYNETRKVSIASLEQVAVSRPDSASHYDIISIVRSEWTKLRTLRSTLWSLVALAVLGIGIGALVSAAKASRFHRHHIGLAAASFDPTRISLSGVLLAQLAIGVLGALFITAEYTTGTIFSTFSAVPRRHLVIIAKVIVFGLVALVASEITCFISFFVGQGILSGSAPYATLDTPGALRAVVAAGLYLTVLGLLALGIGVIVRHTAAAITTFVTILLIFPLILQALPTSYIDAIGKYLPANIGIVLLSNTGGANAVAFQHMFSPWVGFGVLCIYAVVALGVGTVLTIRRDA
jgi:hypothetical protein